MDNKFYELSDDTIKDFLNVIKLKVFSVEIDFQFVGSRSQKSLIKITKLSEQYSFILGKKLLVSINEEMMDIIDEESIQILFEQEIDKISLNTESGKISMVKPDLTTFSSLINKHGIEKIFKANQTEELISSDENNNENKFII
jgi:hypothetical protein